jgi:hypothetical protein
MIHRDLLDVIRADRKRGPFQYPYYGKYSIAEIPPSILSVFGLPTTRPQLPFPLAAHDSCKKVLLFFVDGFGFDHFQKHADLPFFRDLARKGEVYPLTSTFPSTTPAALTAYHVNRTPQEHGLPEWTVYFEEFGEAIEPFPFRPHLTHDRETLLAHGGKPEMLYDGPTFYEELAAGGVRPYMFSKADYADSTYSKVTQRGARVVPYEDPTDLKKKLIETLAGEEGPAYFFANWDRVDGVEHAFGPGSPEHAASLEELSEFLTDLRQRLTPEAAADTLLILSSDHGQTPVSDEEIIYLDDYLELGANYRMSPTNEPIVPTGSVHDVFLHLAPGKVESTAAFLREKLKGKAEVLTTEEAIAQGLFGLYEPTARFRARIGDLVIIPYDGFHVWYRFVPGYHFPQRGIHGGLSEREMLVPLAVAPLARL